MTGISAGTVDGTRFYVLSDCSSIAGTGRRWASAACQSNHLAPSRTKISQKQRARRPEFAGSRDPSPTSEVFAQLSVRRQAIPSVTKIGKNVDAAKNTLRCNALRKIFAYDLSRRRVLIPSRKIERLRGRITPSLARETQA